MHGSSCSSFTCCWSPDSCCWSASVAYRMGRSIVTPLNNLAVAADRIAGGDLTVALRDESADEIGRLTRVFNMMTERLRRSRAEVQAANETLHEQNQQLERLAITDSLTGVHNRKKLDDILADQFARFRRSRRPFAVLMLDLDNFKSINDNYGHAAGDTLLASVAAILKQAIRDVDFVARYGGEEFVVVLVETGLEEALVIAERLRSELEVPPLRRKQQADCRHGEPWRDAQPRRRRRSRSSARPRRSRALQGQARGPQPGAIRDVAASRRDRLAGYGTPSCAWFTHPDRPSSVSAYNQLSL